MTEAQDLPTNSVLEVKLDYIKEAINVIKADVKEIKNDYVSRREFDSKISEISDKTVARFIVSETRIADLYKTVYWVIG